MLAKVSLVETVVAGLVVLTALPLVNDFHFQKFLTLKKLMELFLTHKAILRTRVGVTNFTSILFGFARSAHDLGSSRVLSLFHAVC